LHTEGKLLLQHLIEGTGGVRNFDMRELIGLIQDKWIVIMIMIELNWCAVCIMVRADMVGFKILPINPVCVDIDAHQYFQCLIGEYCAAHVRLQPPETWLGERDGARLTAE
jgi:hypothetical protein